MEKAILLGSISMTTDISICVAITLTGQGVVPADITHHVGLPPTETWRAGELIGKTVLVREHDGWVYAIDQQETCDFEPVMIRLLDTLEPFRERLQSAATRFGLDPEISCVIYTSSSMPSLNFSVNTLVRISMLRCSMDIDIILSD